MKALLLSTLLLLLLTNTTFAQKNRVILGKPAVDIETKIGTVTFKYLKAGDKVDFRPHCKQFSRHPEDFKIEVIARDSTIELTPIEGEPGWYTLTMLAPTRTPKFSYYLYADREFKADVAMPKDRYLPMEDEKGKLIHKNIEWGTTWTIGAERIKLVDISYISFVNR